MLVKSVVHRYVVVWDIQRALPVRETISSETTSASECAASRWATSTTSETSSSKASASSSEASSIKSSGSTVLYFAAGLTPKDTTSKAPSLSEARIQVNLQRLAIQAGALQVLHGIQGAQLFLVDDETEATGYQFVSVETHDDLVDCTTFGEQFIQLFFSGKVRKIANINGFGVQRFAQIVEVATTESFPYQVLRWLVQAIGGMAIIFL